MADNETHPSDDTMLVSWNERYRADFERLNRIWIEKYFKIEQPDLDMFADPFRHVIKPGGEIFFLLEEGKAVGTCGVVPHTAKEYELVKMGVDPDVRGKGYGNRLLQAAIKYAREAGAESIFLTSNTALATALAMYRKHGFVSVPLDGEELKIWERVDIKMRLHLDKEG